MRAFIALDLPGEVAQALEHLQAGVPTGRVVPPQNLHLTLAFLGDVDERAVNGLHEHLDGLKADAPAVSLAGLDVFGGRAPSALFVQAQGSGLLALHDRVKTAARAAGLSLERRRFRPHVTLARFKPGMGRRDQTRLGAFLTGHAEFALPPFTVDHVTLYRSTLRPDGAVHEALAEYALGR